MYAGPLGHGALCELDVGDVGGMPCLGIFAMTMLLAALAKQIASSGSPCGLAS